MKKALLLIALLCIPVAAQEPEPQFKLREFQMALLKRGPKWLAPGAEATALLQRHAAYAYSLLDSDKAMIAGPIQGDSDLLGVYIFRTKSADEAKGWLSADPAVAAGYFAPELHPWWAEDVMKKTDTPKKTTTAYLAFLVRGEKWTPDKTPQTEEIQKAHLANIRRLADLKKLVVAGPFGDNGTLRGIFVFRVASIDEARSLAESDPAVQPGRLALQIHPWLVPEGILP